MQPLHSGIISIPGSLKTWTWKLSPILASQITENHKKVSKVGSRCLPKFTLKSIKMNIWPPVCPLGVLLDPRITKMMSQVPKMEPQGNQNDSFSYKQLPISTVNLLPVASWQGGRRQWAKPSNIYSIPYFCPTASCREHEENSWFGVDGGWLQLPIPNNS